MKIWLAIVLDENDVVFRKVCQSEQSAEVAIVKYLQKNKDYDLHDFSYAFFWIEENNLKLNLLVFETELEEFESRLCLYISKERPSRGNNFIRLTLSCIDILQILDGLEYRRIVWQATVERLMLDYTELSDCVEDCSDPIEAQAIADYYQYLIDTIKKQREAQINQ